MKIFVTGGTGFIGQHVLHKLALQDCSITAVKRKVNISNFPQEINWIHVSMDQICSKELEGNDVLIHMASVGVSPKMASIDELYYWNVGCLANILMEAKNAGIKKVVITGTYAEYGLSADYYDFLPPNAPLFPITSYAASKAAAFIQATAFAIENQIELCYLRIFSAFGEGQFLGNFWPALKDAALNGRDFSMTKGEQVRDFIMVEEVADEIVRSAYRADLEPSKPLIKNVASGNPISLQEFAQNCWRGFEAKGKLMIGDTPYRKNEPMRFAATLDEVILTPKTEK
jgi:nucleoside-diphosphate-sugar epimerase